MDGNARNMVVVPTLYHTAKLLICVCRRLFYYLDIFSRLEGWQTRGLSLGAIHCFYDRIDSPVHAVGSLLRVEYGLPLGFRYSHNVVHSHQGAFRESTIEQDILLFWLLLQKEDLKTSFGGLVKPLNPKQALF